MNLLIAILIGLLFAAGIYCMMRRSLMKVLIGIALLSQGANVLVFSAAGLRETTPVFADSKTEMPPADHADPLPQALVLTAIVIGFGLIVFSLSLLMKAREALATDDINALQTTDQLS
jgi:multicomponent Na+:H+ antiporter subunit C